MPPALTTGSVPQSAATTTGAAIDQTALGARLEDANVSSTALAQAPFPGTGIVPSRQQEMDGLGLTPESGGSQSPSQGASDVRQLNGTVREYFNQTYANPEQAFQNWRNTAEAGVRSGTTPDLTDPTVLGPLKPGVDPATVNTAGIRASMGSYGQATDANRQAGNAAPDPVTPTPSTGTTPSQTPAQAQNQTKDEKSGAVKSLNESLAMAPMSIGQSFNI